MDDTVALYYSSRDEYAYKRSLDKIYEPANFALER